MNIETTASRMTNRVLLSAVALALLSLLAAPGDAAAQKNPQNGTPYRVESFQLSGPGSLHVQTSGGHITVEGSSGNSVRVEMYVRKNGRILLPEDTDLNDWEIDISRSGQTITASAERDRGGWKLFGSDAPSISFVVYTPREISSTLATSGGHIAMSGLSGDQQVRTSGGHIELANIRGNVNARTSGGHITLNDLQGDIEARTSGGSIEAGNSEGDITLRTSGGNITLNRISGMAEAKTSGGNISADLYSINGPVDLRTSGGNISVDVPSESGLDLKLRGSRVTSNLKDFSGTFERDKIEGKINGGGPRLSARTSGGTVSLSFNN